MTREDVQAAREREVMEMPKRIIHPYCYGMYPDAMDKFLTEEVLPVVRECRLITVGCNCKSCTQATPKLNAIITTLSALKEET